MSDFEVVDGRMVRKAMEPDELEGRISKARRPSHLERIWHLTVPSYTRPFTTRQRGVMAHIARAFGNDYPTAARAVVKAVTCWEEFSTRAKAERGLARVPTEPHLGFLLENVEVAGTMVLLERDRAPEGDPGKRKARVSYPIDDAGRGDG